MQRSRVECVFIPMLVIFMSIQQGARSSLQMGAARDGYSSMKGDPTQVNGCDEEKLYMTFDGISSGTLCSRSVRICSD